MVLCNPILPVTWLSYWQLNRFPHQTFLVRRVASHAAGLKPRPVKGWMNSFMRSTSNTGVGM